MTSVAAAATFLGFDGSRSIYRVDLSQVSWSVQSVTFVDDGVRSGGRGGASGADLDFVAFSNSFYNSPVLPTAITQSNSLNADVVFHPGYMAQWVDGDPPIWNTSNFFGTAPGNVFDPNKATLGLADGDQDASFGSISLGDGGQLSLLLNSGVGRYLYFGEYGNRTVDQDPAQVVLSDERAPLAYSGNFTISGDYRSETIAFARGFNTHMGAGNDTVYGMDGDDRIYTSDGNDRIYGGTGYDWLYGENGKDTIYGDAGNDRLFGGAGNDILRGGSGYDTFVFNTKLGTSKTDRKVNFDKIVDFNVKYDSLWLDNAIFKKLGKKGSEDHPAKLSKGFFNFGDHPQDSNDYLLYNKKTGILSYDADGSGSKAAVEFAQLSKHLKLTYKDFFVI